MAKKKKRNMLSVGRAATWWRAIIVFIGEAKDELKKVTWPDRQTTVRYTVVVTLMSLAVGMVIGGVDYLFQLGVELIV